MYGWRGRACATASALARWHATRRSKSATSDRTRELSIRAAALLTCRVRSSVEQLIYHYTKDKAVLLEAMRKSQQTVSTVKKYT